MEKDIFIPQPSLPPNEPALATSCAVSGIARRTTCNSNESKRLKNDGDRAFDSFLHTHSAEAVRNEPPRRLQPNSNEFYPASLGIELKWAPKEANEKLNESNRLKNDGDRASTTLLHSNSTKAVHNVTSRRLQPNSNEFYPASHSSELKHFPTTPKRKNKDPFDRMSTKNDKELHSVKFADSYSENAGLKAITSLQSIPIGLSHGGSTFGTTRYNSIESAVLLSGQNGTTKEIERGYTTIVDQTVRICSQPRLAMTNLEVTTCKQYNQSISQGSAFAGNSSQGHKAAKKSVALRCQQKDGSMFAQPHLRTDRRTATEAVEPPRLQTNPA